ncbi:hypothetical protein BFN03_16550 [Rhodococcus sp. WMMA185]|uniref:hypothetical protein n=1 Tax=Rhodococcus sp. WMMA185 TaxID=679318 RepID=UPI00087909AD|nr:hypothetical protein [Rhodococcus sp. WMMA185]AOW93716.1 hypothetical protein BFN03_16550 [Rhodococcus sp. WMMA185]
MTAAGADEPLDESERAELERLRREVAELRSESGKEPAPSGGERLPGHPALRWTATALLLVLVAALGFAAVLAQFTRGEVLDTDRYVQTVAPLSSNQVLQDELADQVTDELMTRLDVENVTAEALVSITENAERVPDVVVGLAPVIADQARSFVRNTVGSFVASDEFEALWIQANRAAHESLVAVLTGDTRAALEISDEGTVSISLAPIIDRARTILTERGFTFADNIPAIDKSFVLFESPELVRAQRVTSALDTAAGVLPWLTLLAAVGAVWVSPKGRRRKAVVLVGVSLAIAMALLAAAIAIGRSVYLGAVPADVLSPQAAAELIDILLVPLRTTVRAVFALAVVIAIVGYVTGSSDSAVAVRGAYSKAVDAVRTPKDGRDPYPVESVVAQFRIPLRVAIIAIAAMTLVFWRYPSGMVVVVTVLIAVAALLAVELVARPALGERDVDEVKV